MSKIQIKIGKIFSSELEVNKFLGEGGEVDCSRILGTTIYNS